MTGGGAIGAAEFAWVADLVRRESSILLSPGKEYLVESRLLPLANRAGVENVNAYITLARSPGHADTRTAIVDALTTNETSWFRDVTVFDAFRTHLLPQLLATPRPHGQPLRLWSAAASTGQEAYSLAMLLQDDLPAGVRYDIVGTDISRTVLDQARAGRYTQLEVNRGLPAPQLIRHFHRSGAGWQINPDLQRHVTFTHLNLAAPFPPSLTRFDMVFLRNVLIYFDQATKQDVLRRVRQTMTTGGWLILGTAETARGLEDHLTPVRVPGLSAYQNLDRETRCETSSPKDVSTCTQS